jgi:hypothetical protein
MEMSQEFLVLHISKNVNLYMYRRGERQETFDKGETTKHNFQSLWKPHDTCVEGEISSPSIP